MYELMELMLIGFIASILIGLSGMGGGALLMPALVLGLHVPAPIAVGSSLIFSFFIKIYGSVYHYKQTNVKLDLIKNLSLGSIPGCFLGVLLMQAAKKHGVMFTNMVILKTTGIILVVMPIIVLLRFLTGITLNEKYNHLFRISESNKPAGFFVGIIGGFLVGFTSIGGGTIIIMLLLLFFSLNSNELVGTDIIHSAILSFFASFLHIILGNFSLSLVFILLIGGIPGIYLGCRVCSFMPNRLTKGAINIGLMGMGVKILAT